MVNVKRTCYWIMLLLFAAYGAFLLWEDAFYSPSNRRLQIVNQHLERAHEIKRIDGLIVGGSNSYYGLSAAMLSENLGGRWYNASLMNGGFSNQNFLEFVDRIRKSIVSETVKTVIYSSVYVYQKGDIDKRNRAKVEVDGKPPLSLKPQRSVASHVKQWWRSEKSDADYPPLPDAYGDLNFLGTSCPASPIQSEYTKEDPVVVANFLLENLGALHRAFPNAKLYFVFPSLYGGRTLRLQRDETYKRLVANEVKKRMKSKPVGESFAYELIFQPSFPSIDLICDYLHHANPKGRTWRTQDLIAQLAQRRSAAED